jgi:hypothetical protein
MKIENIKRVSLYLPSEEYELLRQIAYKDHIKINDVARAAIQRISGLAIIISRQL